MKKLMCLKTGKLHEVADSTDWGGDYKEVKTFEQDGHIWIKHDGGDCPVPDGWRVRLVFNDTVFETGYPKRLRWTHNGNRGDITEYRVISTCWRSRMSDEAIIICVHFIAVFSFLAFWFWREMK